MSQSHNETSLSVDDAALLGQSRWAVPVMAAMHDTGGDRFAVLANRVRLSPSSLSHVLDHLIACKWVRRNTGHGHPLRPEYLLTPKGREIALHAARLQSAYGELEIGPRTLRRWSIPMALVLQTEALRFSEIKDRLRPATARALSLTVKSLLGEELVEREVVEDFPPITLYRLSKRGRLLAQAL